MKLMNRAVQILVLAACVAAQGQTATVPARKSSKAKPKSQEQILLEHLDQRFDELDQLTRDYSSLQHRVEMLEKELETRDAALDQARKDAASARAEAADAKQKMAATEQAVGPQGANITRLQSTVSELSTTSAALTTSVQAQQQATRKVESPDAISFRGVTLVPGGFLAAETVNRERGMASDVNTPFNSIPFGGQTSGVLSEFNASARQSRISLLAEGKLPTATLRGYYETDFLSAGTTSNDNQSNSYTLRMRQLWAQAELNSHWLLTAGQMWSLATENKHGIVNNTEAAPLTIDAQYNVGFTWERQYGFRVVKQLGNSFWLGGSVEAAQTLNIGGHNLPTVVYQQAGTGGGLYNPLANYSFNYAPDLIAKAVYEPSFGHFEVFGVARFFRDRVFPNGPAPAGAPQPPTTSALGAFTAKTAGGGVGANARVSLFSKRLDLGAHLLAGDGIGRYSTSNLPDATTHPDGSLELLPGGSALGSVEWHATPRFDLYGYYGGEYVKRAFYFTGYNNAATGQPILAGYGAPTNVVSGCYTEVLPVPSPNGGGNVPGTAANCTADTRNLQEATIGYWFRFYKGTHGTLQQGIQYSYGERRIWQGIGAPLTGLSGTPKGVNNMWFTSFRYYLPQ